jgi:hypothetical protein
MTVSALCAELEMLWDEMADQNREAEAALCLIQALGGEFDLSNDALCEYDCYPFEETAEKADEGDFEALNALCQLIMMLREAVELKNGDCMVKGQEDRWVARRLKRLAKEAFPTCSTDEEEQESGEGAFLDFCRQDFMDRFPKPKRARSELRPEFDVIERENKRIRAFEAAVNGTGDWEEKILGKRPLTEEERDQQRRNGCISKELTEAGNKKFRFVPMKQ